MSGTLVFTGSEEEMIRVAAEREAKCVARSSEIPAMIDFLAKGGTAVVVMNRINTGFRVPQGTRLEFTDVCSNGTPERIQAEARRYFSDHEYDPRPLDSYNQGGLMNNGESRLYRQSHDRPEIQYLDVTDLDAKIAKHIGQKARIIDEVHHLTDPLADDGPLEEERQSDNDDIEPGDPDMFTTKEFAPDFIALRNPNWTGIIVMGPPGEGFGAEMVELNEGFRHGALWILFNAAGECIDAGADHGDGAFPEPTDEERLCLVTTDPMRLPPRLLEAMAAAWPDDAITGDFAETDIAQGEDILARIREADLGRLFILDTPSPS